MSCRSSRKGAPGAFRISLESSESSFQAQYIINLAKHRQVDLNPPLESIDDPRNGILLAVQLHNPFGASQVAFLQVSY